NRALDKIGPNAKTVDAHIVEPMPLKSAFEAVAGVFISDERFERLWNAEHSSDLICKEAFEILALFGDGSDVQRLSMFSGDSFLGRWKVYADLAAQEIAYRMPSSSGGGGRFSDDDSGGDIFGGRFSRRYRVSNQGFGTVCRQPEISPVK